MKRNLIRQGILPGNTPKDMVTFGVDSPEKESFTLRHHRNRDIFYADKDDHGVDSRESG